MLYNGAVNDFREAANKSREPAMRWLLTYYDGRLPEAYYSSEHWSWLDLPIGDAKKTGVIRVDVWRGERYHQMQGFDYYWLDEDSGAFGMFNDEKNRAWYSGLQEIAWRFTDTGSVRLPPGSRPVGAHILSGVMLPDADARALGLLGPHDCSPERPI